MTPFHEPLGTLSASSIRFPATTVNTTRYASGITLTNLGNAAMTGIRISLGDASSFMASNTCGAKLASQASCVIYPTFTPAAAGKNSASISVTDDASNSPQSIKLSGLGTTESTTRALYVFPEPDASITPLYALVNSAQQTIDLTMWGLEDTTFLDDLVAACNRGVTVRVILDSGDNFSVNTPAFNQLNAVPNCSAVWANTAFVVTHQKSFILDGTQVVIMSLNLESVSYSSTRDYALLENDPADIAAIQATFNADYAAGTDAAGTVGASDFSYQPGPGDTSVLAGGDLIWSPTTAQADMLSLINNATSTLLVEAEEMDAANIVSALAAACQRGVQVHITMTDDSADFGTEFSALQAAKCGLYLYPNEGEYTGLGFYVHAKAAIADYGLASQAVYMGSINYDDESMTEFRELGIYITDPASAKLLYRTMTSDYAGSGIIY
jgi:phosphatidylserine/phosphatidylglycerophosphate/cardiolipin synthase-like enzyme